MVNSKAKLAIIALLAAAVSCMSISVPASFAAKGSAKAASGKKTAGAKKAPAPQVKTMSEENKQLCRKGTLEQIKEALKLEL